MSRDADTAGVEIEEWREGGGEAIDMLIHNLQSSVGNLVLDPCR